MKRVIVTGATSMIGVATIKECIKNKIKVIALVRKNSAKVNRLPKSDLLNLVYTDANEWKKLSIEDSADVFYHFAWGNTEKTGRDNPFSQEENIRLTLDAVELAHKAHCIKFIGAGSQAEYGIVTERISEKTQANPITAYGMAKLSANLLSRRLCEQYGMTHIWGRIFSVYGCLDNESTMINYAIKKFLNGEKAEFSSATQMWNYLNEQDAGKIFYLLGKQSVPSGVYCIANNKSRQLREYINIIADICGKKDMCVFAKEIAGQKVVSLDVDTDLLTKTIGFIPEVSFSAGIKRIIDLKLGGDF